MNTFQTMYLPSYPYHLSQCNMNIGNRPNDSEYSLQRNYVSPCDISNLITLNKLNCQDNNVKTIMLKQLKAKNKIYDPYIYMNLLASYYLQTQCSYPANFLRRFPNSDTVSPGSSTTSSSLDCNTPSPKDLRITPYEIDPSLNNKKEYPYNLETNFDDIALTTSPEKTQIKDISLLDLKEGLKQRRKRRHRTIFTENQIEVLEDSFCRSQYPDITERELLAATIFLKEERIEIWFKNRRAKLRKLKHNEPVQS
ncbi:unnamed protein product [Gordionus sp. m RMFG-2023]|uniref:homeobox protein ceh-17-like n=1 Tax=Gordionus sp. m RMFG-2023 TaxID=3053472 RepID=UPI0030DEAF88